MTEFTVRAGSITGREHSLRQVNCQDKYRVASFQVEQERFLVGVVCDGCSSGESSEVGAALLAEFTVRETGRLLQIGLPVEAVPAVLYERTLDFLTNFCEEMVGTEADTEVFCQFVGTYLLATVVGFILSDTEGLVFVAGDGFTLVNQELQCYDEGPAPRYLAYDLLEGLSIPKRHGFEVARLETAQLDRLAVWTDGFDPEMLAELNELGDGPRALQRKLNVWAGQKRLGDDTTGILVERKRVNHESQN